MISLNKIDIKHIKSLDANQLTQLLHKLISIEAEKNKLQDCDYLIPFDINTGDEGSDGRIKWSGNPIEKTQWLKNKFTIFQNKATNLSAADCKKEILKSTKGKQPKQLKNEIRKLVENNGCYTLFTNASLNDKGIASRISKFREAIQESGYSNFNKIEIYIFDANQIKDWVNENIATIIFVQEFNGISRPGMFRTWDEWNLEMPGTDIPYETDDTILNNVKNILKSIQNDSIIRIIGHSGLGKTRMVLESFRAGKDNLDVKALQNQLVYFDLGISSNIELLAGYIISHKSSQSGIIVVDNCIEENHNALQALIKNGSFKLITIDFATTTELKSGYIKLNRQDQISIVHKIVESRFKNLLSSSDKEFIANHSEGYPQMAVLFSEAVQRNGLDNLSNELPKNFIKRLLFGRNNESDVEYEVIKACSVFSSFGFLDNNLEEILPDSEKKNLQQQMDFIRNEICIDTPSERQFYKICSKYKDHNIIEQRGRFQMVKPTPLAIYLAAEWWKDTPHSHIKSILVKLSHDQLGIKLVERLSDLDQVNAAKQIVNDLWGPNSPFGIAEVLNTTLGSLLFRYVVEVNPMSTVLALEQSFGNMSKEELLKIDDGRRNLVWALEKLCFRKETFAKATKILYAFAIAENETWGNNSTNQLKQLFNIHLAGTEVNLEARLEIINWGLAKNDDDYTHLGILAMGQALNAHNFMRTGSAERQGSSIPLEDYYPSHSEVVIYWEKVIDILTSIACSDHNYSSLAQDNIAKSVRSLIGQGLIDQICKSIKLISKHKTELWLEALDSLHSSIQYEKLSEEEIEKINLLIDELTPKDLRSKLFLTISQPSWDNYELDSNGNYIDNLKTNAEKLAESLMLASNELWREELDVILKGEQKQAFNFGKKVGEIISDKESIVDNALNLLKSISKTEQNPEFIAGLLVGCNDKKIINSTLNKIMNDADIMQHSFYLMRVSKVDYNEILKLFGLIDQYEFSITSFLNFQYGRPLEHLSNNEVVLICEKIATYGIQGKWAALEICFMYCYEHNDRFLMNINFFKGVIASENLLMTNTDVGKLDMHKWESIVDKILMNKNEDAFAITIIDQIIYFFVQSKVNYSFNNYLKKVLDVLVENYFKIIWPILGQALIDSLAFFRLKNILESRNGTSTHEGFVFKSEERNGLIYDWCLEFPEIGPSRIANIMPLVKNNFDENGVAIEPSWHPLSKKIIDGFGQNEKVLKALSSNMGSYGIVNSAIPYYNLQKKLLQELINHTILEVREWAIKKIQQIDQEIKRESLDEEERG